MALIVEIMRVFSIGGTANGLTGTLVLQNNGTDDLTINADGSFQFTTGLHRNEAYNVTVLTPPTGQTCEVTNGSGTIRNSEITNITVTCTTPPPVTP